MRMTRRRESIELGIFFGLTFGVTWLSWTLAGAMPVARDAPNPVRELLFLPGTVAPALVALWLTARRAGHSGVRSLLGGIAKWRVGVQWYVFALLFMAAVKLAAAATHVALTGQWPLFGDTPLIALLVVTLVSMWMQAGEEVGWRGYALPRLVPLFGLPGASVVLGGIWALWHLPLFLMPGIETSGQSFVLYAASVTALSVVFAWVYWGTGGSLLLVMLLHAAVNNSKYIVQSGAVPSAHPFHVDAPLLTWITAGLLWSVAAYLLVRMRTVRRIEPSASFTGDAVVQPNPSRPAILPAQSE
jgi:membrane protease YdiL (CAAX protease family)